MHIRDGIGPVRPRVWQVGPIRHLSVAVRHVRGKVAGFAVEHRPRFFHEFATRKVIQRFTRLPRSTREKPLPLLTAADDDPRFRGDCDQVETGN